jgi:hypothetical protein
MRVVAADRPRGNDGREPGSQAALDSLRAPLLPSAPTRITDWGIDIGTDKSHVIRRVAVASHKALMGLVGD